jgi:hypothetical protein
MHLGRISLTALSRGYFRGFGRSKKIIEELNSRLTKAHSRSGLNWTFKGGVTSTFFLFQIWKTLNSLITLLSLKELHKTFFVLRFIFLLLLQKNISILLLPEAKVDAKYIWWYGYFIQFSWWRQSIQFGNLILWRLQFRKEIIYQSWPYLY